MKNIAIIICLKLISSFCIANDSNMSFNQHSDSIVIAKSQTEILILKEYQEILEKTNKQLSLWGNPYGILVGILGVLVALLAIIVAFVLFRQNRSNRQLVKDSIGKYEQKLEQIESENKLRSKNYEERLNNLILEYNQILKTTGKEGKKEIQDFIDILKEQVQSIDHQIIVYKHSGWRPKDIEVNFDVKENTVFYAKITLNEIKQAFVIYMRLVTNENKKYWLGFAGNFKNPVHKSSSEYTQSKNYDTKEIVISENIVSTFKNGFSRLSEKPVIVDRIRLRASNDNINEIYYEFKIIGT